MTVHTAHWSITPAPDQPQWTVADPQPATIRTVGDFIKGSVTFPTGAAPKTADFVGGALFGPQAVYCDQVPAVGAFVMTLTWTLEIPVEAIPTSIFLTCPVLGVNYTDVQFENVTPGFPAASNGAWTIPRANLTPGITDFVVRLRGTLQEGFVTVSVAASATPYYTPALPPTTAPATLSVKCAIEIEADEPPPSGPPPTPPAAVRYRDPADGQFKPLSQIAAKGYPAAAPDYGDAGIRWGTDNLITVDWANAVLESTFPAAANIRLTPDANGITVAWDAFDETLQWMGGLAWAEAIPGGTGAFTAKFTVPVSKVRASLPVDDRTYGSVALAENVAGVAANPSPYWRFSLLSDETPAKYGFFDARVGSTRVPFQPSNLTAILLRLNGTNPRMEVNVAKSSYKRDTVAGEAWVDLAVPTFVSGEALPVFPTTAPEGTHSSVLHWEAGSVRLTGVAMTMQEVVAP